MDAFAELGAFVAGDENYARFLYWLNSFYYMRAIARTEVGI